MKKPELLAPAGNMEKLKFALHYGADAVYLAGDKFGLRAKAGNFTADELKTAAQYVHNKGNKSINFGNYLSKRVNCEIVFWDERLTTKFAENVLIEANVRRENRKKFIDKIAAQNILQSYMDSTQN